MTKGKFIIFEGLDLSGKSSIIRELDRLMDNTVFTKEPGSSFNDLCNKIRALLLEDSNMTTLTETYLFAASRAEQYAEIDKILNLGMNVVCDRSVYSSLYYQGSLKGLGADIVNDINKYAIEGLEPDIIFYITVSEEERISRMNKREDINKRDRESMNIDFLNENCNYLNAIYAYKKRPCDIHIIDTTGKEAYMIAKNICEIIKKS